ncbi:MAG TPA: hypothetical protein PK413_02595 [Thermoanaerobaculia bacterium]|nr:hypothetical protein [Thermoanaerobaculia bacterium]
MRCLRRSLFLALALVLLAPVPILAEIGSLEPTPAATLLLPYFEVDLAGPTVTTLFAVTNARAAPALAKVTLWTDLGVPTYDFHIYLTGYDVATFNVADLFLRGTVPGGGGTPPGSCAGAIPVPALDSTARADLQAQHTGRGSSQFGGLCAAVDHGDAIARGFLTVDMMNNCTSNLHAGPGFFIGGGGGDASNANQLLGDYFYVDQRDGKAEGSPMVHLEADDSLRASNYTFYRRFTAGEDQREGLPSQFALRYLNGGALDAASDVQVWRDSKRTMAPFACGTLPRPYPLDSQITAFDEQETSVCFCGHPFPYAAQRVTVGSIALPVPFDFGWLLLNFDTPVTGSQVPFEPLAQAWASVVMRAAGRFSVGMDAFQLNNLTNP